MFEVIRARRSCPAICGVLAVGLGMMGSSPRALAQPAGSPSVGNGAANYYTPPKLKSQGTNSAAVVGAGTVVVKVLVTKSGAATVQGVVRSTNHGDDAAALEIAKRSTYRPALRGQTPLTAFYDYTLRFAAKGGAATDTSDAGGSAAGGVAQFERQIRAGNYAAAQTGLKAYVGQHPSDAKAQLDFGIASAYLGDAPAAAGAFDKAGTVPDNFRALAGKAYNDAASERIKMKDYVAAVSHAKRAVSLAPSAFTYNTLGSAEDASGDHLAAIADIQKARALASADSSFKASDRATIDANLVTAYLGAGKPDEAKPIVEEITRLDPSQSNAQVLFANYYAKSASDLAAAGKYADAAVVFEKSASAAPAQAAASYASAALMYLKVKPNPDNDRAKADADKALAVEPENASANFAAGVALANQPGKTKDALAYLNRADASAKRGSDASLTAAIENVLKQLNGNK